MKIDKKLLERSQSKCELCGSETNLQVYKVAPESHPENEIVICETCAGQIENPDTMDENHWRCLNDSMWSEVPAVQVMAWRLLNRLNNNGAAWAQDLLDMLYLDEDTQAWAEATGEGQQDDAVVHKDSNGAVLQNGDSVVLIKDLKVAGGGFTAKRGTAVRRISLVQDNPEHIEGRVEGQQIVILTKYVKKI
jgi:protein PhnA